MASQLNDPNFGSAKISDPYEQTRETIGSSTEGREQKKLETQIKRELKRGRLSEKTKSEIVSQALEDFAQRTIQSKINSVTAEKKFGESGGAEVSTTSIGREIPTVPLPPQIPTPTETLSSEVIQVCKNGQKANMRVYGGIEEFLGVGCDEGGGCIGLALYIRNEGTTKEVWLSAGSIAGQPIGGQSSDGIFIASSGGGDVWVEVTINETSGQITSATIGSGGNTPSNTNNTFYYTLGLYGYSFAGPQVTNYGCGSVSFFACRNWFVVENKWTPIWNR
jgi:hypothetical protein